MNNSLGIYFGPKAIGIVEVKGKNVLNRIIVPNTAFMSGGLEDKVPEEIKIVALLKEELRKNGIQAKEATVALSGIDLIIRTFEIPILPANELPTAINFEAKKYIPFKIENMVFNFQAQVDKISRRTLVLFLGVKREILEKYLSIFNQLEIKINVIEYSALSILRLLELSGCKEKGTVGVINVDFKEGDDADFTVIEKGFPLFSRDIKLATGSFETPEDPGMISERLKTEIRISLDYYNRKFPAKKIKQIYYISSSDSKANIEPFVQELGLSFQFIDPSKIIGKDVPFSLNFLKAYSSALSGSVKSSVKVNILSAWEKAKQSKEALKQQAEPLSSVFSGVKINFFAVALAVLICAVGYGLGIAKKIPLEKNLKNIIASRPQILDISPQATLEELFENVSKFRENLGVMDKLVKNQVFLTPLLSIVPDLFPEGAWLESFYFSNTENGAELIIEGSAYLGNNSKEMEAANNFLQALRADQSFSQIFKTIRINSVDIKTFKGVTVTHFVISGHS